MKKNPLWMYPSILRKKLKLFSFKTQRTGVVTNYTRYHKSVEKKAEHTWPDGKGGELRLTSIAEGSSWSPSFCTRPGSPEASKLNEPVVINYTRYHKSVEKKA